jgi:ParB-like chromosome segregation protein Spo0J
MAKTQRVIFSFDERSLESLQKIKEQGHFTSMGEAVRESLPERKESSLFRLSKLPE